MRKIEIKTTLSSFKVPTGSMGPTILPGDTFEIRRGINQVRGFEGALGNVDRQRMLPESYIVGIATRIWKSIE